MTTKAVVIDEFDNKVLVVPFRYEDVVDVDIPKSVSKRLLTQNPGGQYWVDKQDVAYRENQPLKLRRVSITEKEYHELLSIKAEEEQRVKSVKTYTKAQIIENASL